MSWRTTILLAFFAAGSLFWSVWRRPFAIRSVPQLDLAQYTHVELQGASEWTMVNDGGWFSVHPARARLSNFQVEQWLAMLEKGDPCLPPSSASSQTLRFSDPQLGASKDVSIWYDVEGPAKILVDQAWYSVSSEVLDPIRFGLAPFRTLQIVPPSFSPEAVRITVGDVVAVEMLKSQTQSRSWSLQEPLFAPVDLGALQSWLDAVEQKTATAILGEVEADDRRMVSGLFPVATELSLVGANPEETRSIRFGKRLQDGSRLAQVRGEDVVFVVGSDDAEFMLTSPTRFLFPTCTTTAPERFHSISVGSQTTQRNSFDGRFDQDGQALLDMLTLTRASNFALAASQLEGVPVEARDSTGAVLFSGMIQAEGGQVAVWNDGLARLLPVSEDLILWIQSAAGTSDPGPTQ